MTDQPKSREEYLKERQEALELIKKSGKEREAYWAQRRPKTREEYLEAFEAIYGRPEAPKCTGKKKK